MHALWRFSPAVAFALTGFALAACTSKAATTTGASTTSSSTTTSTSTGSGGAGGAGDPVANAVKATNWVKLTAAPTVGAGAKQDDIYFLDAMNGFLANGPNAAIYATTDGGTSWSKVFSHAGTYFRSVLFTDAKNGFAGNIGAGLSAQITDATLIYQTKDGGTTWTPTTNITGATAQGICNFNEIDASHIVGVGRANAPANILVSSDGGANWVSTDLSSQLSMAIDVHFFSANDGLIAGMDKSFAHCSILRTTDGGTTWNQVFSSKRAGSLCWKLDFPSTSVGYAAVQDSTTGPGSFAKTTDGGATWTENPLPLLMPPTKGYDAIGIGFITENIGWVSAETATLPVYRTFDGGTTWEVDPALEAPINRFRFVDKHTSYAVGASVWKLTLP